MGNSPEYPDLPLVRPASWGGGREAPVQYIVIHYTAGSEGPTSAMDGALYDQRRTDGTSCHYFIDRNWPVVQCVETWNTAYSAFRYGNARGIQYELCGTLQSRAQWLDAASRATIENAARQAARDCKKYGIPARKIGPNEMLAGQKGICGHGDVTAAYGLGDHTDPGPEFPWDVFLERLAAFMDPPPAPPVHHEDEEDEMAKPYAVVRNGGPDVPADNGGATIKYGACFALFSATEVKYIGPGELDALDAAGVPRRDTSSAVELKALQKLADAALNSALA